MLADCTRITTSENDINQLITRKTFRKSMKANSYILDSLRSGDLSDEDLLFSSDDYDYESLRDSIARRRLLSSVKHVSPFSLDTVVLGHLIDLNGFQIPPRLSSSPHGIPCKADGIIESTGNTFMQVCHRLKQKLVGSKSRIRRATLFNSQRRNKQEERAPTRKKEHVTNRLLSGSATTINERPDIITRGPTYITGSAGSSNSVITIIHYSTERTSSFSSDSEPSGETFSDTSEMSMETSLLASFNSSTAVTTRSTNIFNLLAKC